MWQVYQLRMKNKFCTKVNTVFFPSDLPNKWIILKVCGVLFIAYNFLCYGPIMSMPFVLWEMRLTNTFLISEVGNGNTCKGDLLNECLIEGAICSETEKVCECPETKFLSGEKCIESKSIILFPQKTTTNTSFVLKLYTLLLCMFHCFFVLCTHINKYGCTVFLLFSGDCLNLTVHLSGSRFYSVLFNLRFLTRTGLL
jgi:hypothetical protein